MKLSSSHLSIIGLLPCNFNILCIFELIVLPFSTTCLITCIICNVYFFQKISSGKCFGINNLNWYDSENESLMRFYGYKFLCNSTLFQKKRYIRQCFILSSQQHQFAIILVQVLFFVLLYFVTIFGSPLLCK